MSRNIEASVRAGMAWLDKRFPDHVTRVNLETLDVSQNYHCPLGQASGIPFLSRDSSLGLSDDDAWEYGFLGSLLDGGPYLVSCRLLTAEWRRQYEERIDAIMLEANEYQAEVERRD